MSTAYVGMQLSHPRHYKSTGYTRNPSLPLDRVPELGLKFDMFPHRQNNKHTHPRTNTYPHAPDRFGPPSDTYSTRSLIAVKSSRAKDAQQVSRDDSLLAIRAEASRERYGPRATSPPAAVPPFGFSNVWRNTALDAKPTIATNVAYRNIQVTEQKMATTRRRLPSHMNTSVNDELLRQNLPQRKTNSRRQERQISPRPFRLGEDNTDQITNDSQNLGQTPTQPFKDQLQQLHLTDPAPSVYTPKTFHDELQFPDGGLAKYEPKLTNKTRARRRPMSDQFHLLNSKDMNTSFLLSRRKMPKLSQKHQNKDSPLGYMTRTISQDMTTGSNDRAIAKYLAITDVRKLSGSKLQIESTDTELKGCSSSEFRMDHAAVHPPLAPEKTPVQRRPSLRYAATTQSHNLDHRMSKAQTFIGHPQEPPESLPNWASTATPARPSTANSGVPFFLPLKCSICYQGFNGPYQRGNLIRHHKTNHCQVPYAIDDPERTCRVCGRMYLRKDARLKHEWKKHNIEDAKPKKRRKED
jgi:hypothetical protein